MPTDKPQLKTYINKQDKAKFSHIAKNDRRSDSNLLEYIVLNYIEDYEKEHGQLIVGEDGKVTLAQPKVVKQGKSSNSKTG
ncbi:hypothetical protein SAMN02745136_00101 [Anaerocolumna jejuensis DSM 15929]|uniref:Uncharacterized protein n=1 Tax=Anaerocolumna jejuensis DSM 15929 TaxID=1121322 RepID=A0A1M6JIZ5_9FIRM|nr:hypothetical protein [Anaerocolumna jejuensis]SHJ46691.1 hypothetical protein SAMN02745136_00101 [Anaerocolumna jejuensis DSM 15929]